MKNNYEQLHDPNLSILDYGKVKVFIQSCLDGTGAVFNKLQHEQDMLQLLN